MPFVKVTKTQKDKMYREGGWRERNIMDNAKCATRKNGMPGCVTFHDGKGRTATYKKGRGWVN